MNKFNQGLLCTAMASLLPLHSALAAETISEALKSSTVSGDFRLRYEDVEVGNTDSDGLTLRTLLNVKTADYQGFTAVITVEDVRDILSIDDENNLIPDPEGTELDQAFIQYNGSSYSAKLGRQVITLDNHRFVGHVGFRQDRQTFDAVSAIYTPSKDLTLNLAYIVKRNRIFAETMDAQSNDILLNGRYNTPIGKVVAYTYLLDDDVRDEQSDTFGVSLSGDTDAAGADIKLSYYAEYATQSIDDSGADYDTDYLMLEGGVTIAGITAKLGYELLGSDDGKASFTTPLATLHKFNGWNDIFLGGTFDPAAMPNGLEDTYLSVGTVISDIKLLAVYHDYSADEGSDNYGDEIAFSISKTFKNNTSIDLTYASYEADSYSVDKDTLWLTAGYKF